MQSTPTPLNHLPTPGPPTALAGPDATDVEALGERIAELSALLSATEYQLLVLIREFDERVGWAGGGGGGFRSCAHWLNWRTGLALGSAREKVRVARALADLPVISAAMERGELSFSKVRALTRVATVETERDLLAFAQAGTAAHVERLVRAWKRTERAEDPAAEAARHADRHLSLCTAADGMVIVRGRLDPETGAALARALEAAEQVLFDERVSSESPSESPSELKDETSGEEGSTSPGRRDLTAAQRRADAIGRVAEAALEGGLDRGTRGDRYQVVVHVEAPARAGALDEGGETETLGTACGEGESAGKVKGGLAFATIEGVAGTPLDVSAETSRRIACDASRITMTHDPRHQDARIGGRILDVGRRTRAIHPALRRALDHRDRGCRFPGCELAFCDAHHVEHWADGGETKLDNLVLLCRRHHRAVHEGGCSVELDAGGRVRFTDPHGRELPDAPSLPALPQQAASPEAAIALLASLLDEADLEIDPMVSFPSWDGRPLDLCQALDMLMN